MLEPDDPPPPPESREGLLEGLKQGGIDGKAQLELRLASAPAASLAELAKQQVTAGTDVALSVTTAGLAALLPAAPAVIFTDVADPAAGGARSPALLARWLPALFGPKGPPVTGAYTVNDFGRLLELAAPVTPVQNLGAVFAPHDADSVAYRDQLRAFAGRTVLSEPLDAAKPAAAVQALCEQQARTLVLLGDRSTDAVMKDLIDAARSCRMVVLGTRPAHATAGAVVTLARDQRAGATAAGRRAAAFMHGERPQLEPFERVTTATVLLNAEAAEQVGVGLPLDLIAKADDVIGE